MDSPFAPKPVAPGLLPPRVERSSPDRRRKGRSFEDELAGERDEAGSRGPRSLPVHPPAPSSPASDPAPQEPSPPNRTTGLKLDIEA